VRYDTHFCTSADGTRIAYAVAPGKAPAAVMIPGWPGTIEVVGSGVVGPNLWSAGHETVWFDRRGIGVSERAVDDISLARQVEDLAAVINDYTIDPVRFYASWDGTPIALAYAALHPDKVLRMALAGPYARGEEIISREALQSTVEMARTNWALTRRSLAAIGLRVGADAETYMEALRRSITPEMAAKYLEQYGTMDATQYLDHVKTPTLVLHRPHDGAVPRAATELVASRLANCRFVVTRSREEHGQMIRSFLWDHDDRGPSDAGGTGTAIILFADIVDSTALTEKLGDTAFREKARALDEAMRSAIRDNSGTAVEGKTLGDGVLAVFTSAKQAIGCAQACHDAAVAEGLALHAGIHAGDVIREADNVYGGAVNIAARIAATSAAGETLVSGTVRELARTSAGVVFEDRGEQALKGIGETVRVWAVRWQVSD
jgi:class 3 adenylate cyclase/alpha-beta hydrolase superfamily lysophospholipase